MKTGRTTTKHVTLSVKCATALEYFADTMGMSQSMVLDIALINYFMAKDEIRNNPKWREIIGQEEIEFYEWKMKQKQ